MLEVVDQVKIEGMSSIILRLQNNAMRGGVGNITSLQNLSLAL
jgi:hypothetical protein